MIESVVLGKDLSKGTYDKPDNRIDVALHNLI
jgi:hypothetical protein